MTEARVLLCSEVDWYLPKGDKVLGEFHRADCCEVQRAGVARYICTYRSSRELCHVLRLREPLFVVEGEAVVL